MQNKQIYWYDENRNKHEGEFLCIHNTMTVTVPHLFPNFGDNRTINIESVDAAAYVVTKDDYGESKVTVIPAQWIRFKKEGGQ